MVTSLTPQVHDSAADLATSISDVNVLLAAYTGPDLYTKVQAAINEINTLKGDVALFDKTKTTFPEAFESLRGRLNGTTGPTTQDIAEMLHDLGVLVVAANNWGEPRVVQEMLLSQKQRLQNSSRPFNHILNATAQLIHGDGQGEVYALLNGQVKRIHSSGNLKDNIDATNGLLTSYSGSTIYTKVQDCIASTTNWQPIIIALDDTAAGPFDEATALALISDITTRLKTGEPSIMAALNAIEPNLSTFTGNDAYERIVNGVDLQSVFQAFDPNSQPPYSKQALADLIKKYTDILYCSATAASGNSFLQGIQHLLVHMENAVVDLNTKGDFINTIRALNMALNNNTSGLEIAVTEITTYLNSKGFSTNGGILNCLQQNVRNVVPPTPDPLGAALIERTHQGQESLETSVSNIEQLLAGAGLTEGDIYSRIETLIQNQSKKATLEKGNI